MTTIPPTVEAARRMVRAIAPDAEEIRYDMEPPRSRTMMWKSYRFAVETAVGVDARCCCPGLVMSSV